MSYHCDCCGGNLSCRKYFVFKYLGRVKVRLCPLCLSDKRDSDEDFDFGDETP